MAPIAFSRTHALGAVALKNRLVALEDKLRDRYGVNLSWRGNVADVRGPGVTGMISVDEQLVEVALTLGLLMRPLAAQIEEAMRRQIDRALTG